MKHASKSFFLTLGAAAMLAAPAFAADFKIDPSHSSVNFTVKHLVSKVKGQFKDFDGTFNWDAAKATDGSGKFVVKTTSVFTGNDKRDEHLRSGDFFDAQKYPEMTLDKIKLKPAKGKDKYKMTAELTLHGVTKPVSFDVEYGGVAKDPWGNTRAGFTAEGKINRKDYGIVWNKTLDAGGLMLGDEVAIEIQVEGIENKPADAAAKPKAE